MTSKSPRLMEVLTPDTIAEAVDANHDALRSFIGDAKVAIETAEMAQMGYYHVNIEVPSRVEVEVMGPFGIPMARIKVDGENYSVHEFLRGEVYEGNPDSLSRVMGFPVGLGVGDFIDALTGLVPILRSGKDSLSSWRVDDGKYLLTTRRGEWVLSNWVDPGMNVVVKQIVSDSEGNQLVEKRFEDFELLQGVLIPRLIYIIGPSVENSVGIYYENMEVNGIREDEKN